ncbi:SixA phosphatase family protein [Rheinheimera maricola]|uniref:Histidine phosphatase family protein n=1 Tax=Rheinheimera maricola TaxID=2793282 RepID=A0ABS7X978_9GAMM|nr:phosphoglycerate mutase family protein [Rheinheimera maricola]MBZ9611871.1 histidine phosphatase family protein [Rheinheimera maricola]
MQVNLKLLMSGGLSLAIWLLSSSAVANTVYLVRHAEKQNDGKDPALTACGQARAQALAAYFADVPLAAVYATPYQRTQQTAAAVAGSKKLAVTSYDPRQPEQLLQQLTALSQPVLVVGHSNTVPQLVSLASGIEMAPLTEQDYSLLYQLELAEQGSVTLSHQAFTCDAQLYE